MCCTSLLRSGAPVTASQAKAVVTMAENLGLEVTIIKKSAEEEVVQGTTELEEVEPVKPNPRVWSAPYHANFQRSSKESPGPTNLKTKRKEPSFRENESPIPLPVKGYRKQQPQTDPDVEKQHDKLTRKEIKLKRDYDRQELMKQKKKMRKERFDEDKQAREGTNIKSRLTQSLWPNPRELTHIICNHKEVVPVSVFGQPLPSMPPQPFSLPWIVQEDETVTEDSKDNNKPPSQTIPSANASNLKLVARRNPAAVFKSKPDNLITSLAKPFGEPKVLKQAVGRERQRNVVEAFKVPGLTFSNDENNATSSNKILLQERFVSVKSTQDKIKETLNISTDSLGSKTPEKLFPTNSCYICDICGSKFIKEYKYKKHLILIHHRESLMQRYKKSVEKNLCQICNFSSKASTESQKTSIMVVHLGVKHSKGFQAGNL